MSTSNSTTNVTSDPAGTSSTTSNPPPAPTTPTTSAPPPPPPATTPTTALPPPPTNTPPTSSNPPPPPQSSPTTSAQQQPPPSTTPPPVSTETTIVTPPGGGEASTIVVTKTEPVTNPRPTNTGITTSGLPGAGAPNNNPNGSGNQSTDNAKTIAIATVVPIVVVALLVLGGLFFWRKRKQRMAAEEERRKEVEEYGFNPNAGGPTAPDVSTVGGYEDASSGYRGWGSTTLAGSTGRKASTTMSGGAAPVAYSDGTAASPTQGNVSDARSVDPLMHGRGDGAVSPEGEILGVMGPAASGNRGADVRRGPSNASSSYSAAARSDGSGEGIGMAYGGDARYYDGYGNGGPYSDAYGASPPRAGENGGASSPVIKDNPARRNTRIENSGHYPQQAGISQNF